MTKYTWLSENVSSFRVIYTKPAAISLSYFKPRDIHYFRAISSNISYFVILLYDS